MVVTGADLNSMSEERLARWRGETVGIVFQFFQLLPTLTALENAALPMDFVRRWKPPERWARAQVALAVGTLLGLLSLALAVSRVTDQSWNVLDYDITLSAQPGGSLYTPAVVNQVRAQPGVAGVEATDWSQMTYRGEILHALGVHADTFVREPLAGGRWLSSRDETTAAPVAVVGASAARRWHLQPGSRVTVGTSAGPATFTVVGVGGSQANNGFNVYTTLPALQRITGHSGAANTLFIRVADKDHHAIDPMAARLEGVVARSGHPSRSQLTYAGRATDKATSGSMMVIRGRHRPADRRHQHARPGQRHHHEHHRTHTGDRRPALRRATRLHPGDAIRYG